MKRTISMMLLGILTSSASFSQTPRTLTDEGIELKKNGQCQEAVKKFNQALTLDPKFTEALYEKGWCQSELKNYAEALSTLRKVRNSWNQMAKVHFEIGYAFQQLNQPDSAKASYQRCLDINPDYSLVPKQLGNVYYNEENYPEALRQYNLYVQKSKTEIKDYLFWYRKGYCENNGKDYTNAKISLAKSLEFKNDYANTYLELGYANSKMKENDAAINWFKKAIELQPKDHIAYNGIGEVYRDNLRDMDMAMSWYQKSLNVNPTERKANFGMGYCLNSKLQYADAIPYLKQAIKSEDTYTAAYTELGYSYFKTGSNSLALENLKKSISLNAKSVNPYYYLTLVYIKMGDKTNAQKMVDELKNLNSKYAQELQDQVNKM